MLVIAALAGGGKGLQERAALSLKIPPTPSEAPASPPNLDKVIATENKCISIMLLGSVGFMMSNFYLVNWPDPDIKKISWEVISSTISIFSSILIFQAIDDVLELYVWELFSPWAKVAMRMIHMLFWFVVLMLMLAYFSGAVAHLDEDYLLEQQALLQQGSATANSEEAKHLRKAVRRIMRVMTIDTKAWGKLLGDMTGFAATAAFGSVQQALPHTPAWGLFSIFVALLGLVILFWVSHSIREQISLRDGKLSEFEELWDEEISEVEDDVLALALSFLIVQVLRMIIVGQLPDLQGGDTPNLQLPDYAPISILALGAVAACLQVGKSILVKNDNDRVHNWFRDILSMCLAWSLHWGVMWWATIHLSKLGAPSLIAVLGALVVSVLAWGLIFILDKLADQDWTDETVDRSLRAFIRACGVLIGFSWENSFETAVGGVVDGLPLPAPVVKLLMALVLASMVIPAWKWYILEKALPFEEEATTREAPPAASALLLKVRQDLEAPRGSHRLHRERHAKTTSLEESHSVQSENSVLRSEVERLLRELKEKDQALQGLENRLAGLPSR